VAVNPNGEILYVAQTARGSIMAIQLDMDGDETVDSSDADIDGDGTSNASELTAGTDPWIPPDRGGTRPLAYFGGPVLRATGSGNDQMNVAGTVVDGIEWYIDRFAAHAAVPSGGATPIPAGKEAPFILLGDDTVALAAPRGAFHETPVWSEGIDRSTELGTSGAPVLAPVIMANRSPTEYQFKDVSGYQHCDDWSLDDTTTFGLQSDGQPSTTCGRDIEAAASGTILSLGIRRAHLSHWASQWHPFGAAGEDAFDNSGEGEIVPLDADGDGIRDAAVFMASGTAGQRPMMVHIGNLSVGTGANTCPGDFALTDLGVTWDFLSPLFEPELDEVKEPQFRCYDGYAQFFTPRQTSNISVMTDYHAEWRVRSNSTTTNYAAEASNRLSLGVSGDGDPTGTIGFVPETAYRILEQSLKVTAREETSADYGAALNIDEEAGPGEISIEVSYVQPVSPVLGLILGKDSYTVARKKSVHLYSSGDNS
ncbi:MAG: hypothetical protein KDD44_08940, partial [Bdellovibrionales bacterium]|nr:hypothetical protein [Bdellovibrionales bacterium]